MTGKKTTGRGAVYGFLVGIIVLTTGVVKSCRKEIAEHPGRFLGPGIRTVYRSYKNAHQKRHNQQAKVPSDCEWCHGKGDFDCLDCAGKGTIPFLIFFNRECPSCKGKKTFKCPLCNKDK